MARLLLLPVAFVTWTYAATLPPPADQQLARDIYKQIIEIKSGYTTDDRRHYTCRRSCRGASADRGISAIGHLPGRPHPD
jgi:hypothetical protein